MPDINDYLIAQEGKDFGRWLSGWSPPLPDAFAVWMVNRFAEIIAVFEDGSVHRLDLGTGIVEKLADSQDDFVVKIDQDNNADDWLLISLTDACVEAGMNLGPNECYSYVIPPFLGGEYDLGNIRPLDLQVYYEMTADIYRQTKDLPDGAKVELKVVE